MFNLKIQNQVFRGCIHGVNEFLLNVARKNVRRIELNIEITVTSPPHVIEWHGEWIKVVINGKEFISRIDDFYGMDDKEILKYIESLD